MRRTRAQTAFVICLISSGVELSLFGQYDGLIYFAIYHAIICKEADIQLNVVVYAVYVYQEGPITEPCGTPDVTYVMSDRAPLT